MQRNPRRGWKKRDSEEEEVEIEDQEQGASTEEQETSTPQRTTDKKSDEQVLEKTSQPSDSVPSPAASTPQSDLVKALEEKTKLAEDYLNRLRYLQAEFDNYKKWSERDRSEFTKIANEKLVRALLPTIDTLEKALESTKNEKSTFRDGVQLIYSELMNALKASGLAPILPVGKKFDPFRMEALLTEVRSDVEDGVVLEEMQKGYTLNDRVVRTSKVKVSRKPDGDEGNNKGSALPGGEKTPP